MGLINPKPSQKDQALQNISGPKALENESRTPRKLNALIVLKIQVPKPMGTHFEPINFTVTHNDGNLDGAYSNCRG